MAKQAYVYSGTDWVPLASEVTNLSDYQTKALAQAPYRNLIINGAMQVAQRGTSTASITTGNYYTVDRWTGYINTLGTWTQSVETDAPTGSGFRKSLKMLCTTADASPAAADVCNFYTTLEGQNLQAIKKGTAAAEQLTISFWVKSNVTGTYVVEFYDNDNTRHMVKQYTISSSTTWEKKTITFPADTTGAFDNDNNGSLNCIFYLSSGSDRTSGTLPSSWASVTDANRAVGQTNLAAATDNYWQITGVQLEVGDTATPFEFKPFEDDLMECQRYYWRTTATGSNYASIIPSAVSQSNTNVLVKPLHPVPMRGVASSIEFANIGYQRWDGTLYAISAMTVDTSTRTIYSFNMNATVSGPGASTAGSVIANNNTAAYFAVSAEL